MRHADRAALICALGALAWPGLAAAQTPSRAEAKRKRIEEQLGLDEAPRKPPAPAAADSAPTAPSPRDPPPTAVPAATTDAQTVPFVGPVHGLLTSGCRACHGAGGSATGTRFVLTGSARADFATTIAFVDRKRPRASTLLTKGAGEAHGGGAIFAAGSRQHRQLLAWIASGARPGGDEAGAAPTPVVVAKRAPASRTSGRAAAVAPAAAPPQAPPATLPPPSAADQPQAPAVLPPAQAPDPRPREEAVAALLARGCASCHAPGGSAGATRFVLTGDRAADLAAARAFVNPAAAAESPLVAKAAGVEHAGGVIFVRGGLDFETLRAFATSTSTSAHAVATPAPQPAAPVVAAAAPPAAAAVVSPAALTPPPDRMNAAHASPAVTLPFGFRLNGRFDLNYERRHLGRHTGVFEGDAGLRSYHQLLFLSRSPGPEGVGLSVDVIGLQLWEATYSRPLPALGALFLVRGGKILVPFGTEPLYHQLYGGLAGFDQRLLPALWTQEGLAARLAFSPPSGVSLSFEPYVVRGHRLRAADTLLNLQSDFSPAEDVKLAVGHRLGIAWRALSLWHSAYYNPLGHGRRLFLQALDLAAYRWPGIPVVDRIAIALGALRADVSGGGPGEDYYHVGTYFQARFFVSRWLYLQYRQGLRTFGNRRGRVVDETRLDAADGSTHGFAVVARFRGLSGGLAYYRNLEKADEMDDDFWRVTVAYEF